MLVARGKLEHRQAIIQIGLLPLTPTIHAVTPEQAALVVPVHSYRALIDTGAQRTCLTNATIQAERLIRHGKRLIKNVHSEALHGLYGTRVGFFCNGTTDDIEKHHTFYALQTATEVINIDDNHQFDAIVGMDLLQQFDFTLDRTGHFELRLN